MILKNFPEFARIILVKKDGQPVASGLVLAFKDRLYVPSAAAYVSALKYCPNHALYWEVIKKACEEGRRYFDFGRSKIDSNTFKFKKQWVPTPTSLYWQYHLGHLEKLPSIDPSNPKYKLFISLWRRLPLSVANYFGPKLIRNFP
jgi:serine/alanine adding enzyme